MPQPTPVEKEPKLTIEGQGNVTAVGGIECATIVTGDTIHQGVSFTEVIDVLIQTGILRNSTTPVSETAFAQLIGLVNSIKFTDEECWFRLYCVCLPIGAHITKSTISAHLLKDLCFHPWTKGWPPLFEFVERLALVEEAKGLVPPLNAWVDANAVLVMPSDHVNQIKQLRKELRSEQKKPTINDFSYLQVYLEPDLLNRTQQRKQPLFKVELVLWSARTGAPLVLPIDEATNKGNSGLWQLNEIPSLLDKVFVKGGEIDQKTNINNIVIEVFAPSDLLSYGFEHWPCLDGLTYGINNPLVVRLPDRFTIPNAVGQARADAYWKEKWAFFEQQFRNNGCDALHWLPQAALENRRLTLVKLQKQKEAICIGVAVALASDKHDVFEIFRDAGIPIALWLRGEHPDYAALTDLKERITPLLNGKKLKELYNAVHAVRYSDDAFSKPAFIGNFLTLLWDDPTRPPYKYAEQGVFQ